MPSPAQRAADAVILRHENRIAELEEALRRIERLRTKWDAPLEYEATDVLSTAAWAAVGSEAHAIATVALERGSE